MSTTRDSEFEMGYTVREFSNVLHGDFSGDQSPYKCNDISSNHWHMNDVNSDLKVDIHVLAMPPRKLGLLELPVLKVQFQLSGSDESDKSFFDKFFKYFHKGDG